MLQIPTLLRERPWALAYASVVVLFVYALVVLYTYFLAGRFAYHDVTLTNDFLSAFVHGRGFFWITDYGMSHFKVHFTPTFVLFGPLYLIWDSQFLLLALTTVCLYASIWLTLGIYRRITELAFCDIWQRQPLILRVLLPLALVALMSLNLYTKSTVLAANAWLPYLFFLTLAAFMLLRNARWFVLVPLALLALGVRQDAGLYFAFQLSVFWFLPIKDAALRTQIRKKILVLGALAVAYVAAAVFIAMPNLGAVTHVDRGWHQYGDTWVAIISTFLHRPWLLIEIFKNSAFVSLNAEFMWLPLFSPWAFLFNNLPAALLYACDDQAKRYLDYYNANFVLPGMAIASWWGAMQLLRYSRRLPLGATSAVFSALLVGVIAYELSQIPATTRSNDFTYVPIAHSASATKDFRQQLATTLAECPALRKITADFRNVVFLPNDTERYLLQNFRNSDAVIMQMGTGIAQVGFPSSDQIAPTIESEGAFELKAQVGATRYYLRRGFNCGRPG